MLISSIFFNPFFVIYLFSFHQNFIIRTCYFYIILLWISEFISNLFFLSIFYSCNANLSNTTMSSLIIVILNLFLYIIIISAQRKHYHIQTYDVRVMRFHLNLYVYANYVAVKRFNEMTSNFIFVDILCFASIWKFVH